MYASHRYQEGRHASHRTHPTRRNRPMGPGTLCILAEKERRSGSMRTVQSYSRMLQHFFGLVAKTPERITSPEVFSWAHGIGLSGKRPSSITIGARLACLSSLYRFLIRMGLMAANPCDAIARPKTVPH